MKFHRIAKERSEHRILAIEEGQLVCPRQGVVDLERCWVCPAFDGMSAGRIEGVVCKADLADPIFVPHSAVQ